jgi:hypothetical protein
LGAGLTIQPLKSLLLRNPIRRGQGPYWAVEPYDDDEDDDDADIQVSFAISVNSLFEGEEVKILI